MLRRWHVKIAENVTLSWGEQVFLQCARHIGHLGEVAACFQLVLMDITRHLALGVKRKQLETGLSNATDPEQKFTFHKYIFREYLLNSDFLCEICPI